MTIRELFSKCRNVNQYAVKITIGGLNVDRFNGEAGEPVPERLLDDEIVRWWLPEAEDDTIEIIV